MSLFCCNKSYELSRASRKVFGARVAQEPGHGPAAFPQLQLFQSLRENASENQKGEKTLANRETNS